MTPKKRKQLEEQLWKSVEKYIGTAEGHRSAVYSYLKVRHQWDGTADPDTLTLVDGMIVDSFTSGMHPSTIAAKLAPMLTTYPNSTNRKPNG